MKKILFQDTSFRDGFQSVFGARVLTEDFIPAVEAAREGRSILRRRTAKGRYVLTVGRWKK